MPGGSHFLQRFFVVLQEKVVGPLRRIGPYAHNLQGIGTGAERGIDRFAVYVKHPGIHQLIGIVEAMGAGYISSAYKDAIPFVLILLILFFMPRGLFGGLSTERV